MTPVRKNLIVAGALLIALLIATAAFSLGFYVGANGLDAGQPPVAGPGPRQPGAPVPVDAAPAFPDPLAGREQPPAPNRLDGNAGRPASEADRTTGNAGRLPLRPRPQLVGEVQSVEGETITLNTPQGLRGLTIAPDARVFRQAEGGDEPATLDEVVPGKHLAAYGRPGEGSDGQLLARRLVLVPPPPARSRTP